MPCFLKSLQYLALVVLLASFPEVNASPTGLPRFPELAKRSDVICVGTVKSLAMTGKQRKMKVPHVASSGRSLTVDVWVATMSVTQRVKGSSPDMIKIAFYQRPARERDTNKRYSDDRNYLLPIGKGAQIVFLKKAEGAFYEPTSVIRPCIAIHPDALELGERSKLSDIFEQSAKSFDSYPDIEEHLAMLRDTDAGRGEILAKQFLGSASVARRFAAVNALLTADDPEILNMAVELATKYAEDEKLGIGTEVVNWNLPGVFSRSKAPPPESFAAIHRLLDPGNPLFTGALGALCRRQGKDTKQQVVICLRRFPKMDVENQYNCIRIVSMIDGKSYAGGYVTFRKKRKEIIQQILDMYPQYK